MLSIRSLISAACVLPFVCVSANNGQPSYGGSNCDVSKATISGLPASLAQNSSSPLSPSFIAVALGTQNYTCSAAGNYTNIGAVAELFDISCFYGQKLFDESQDIAIQAWKYAPSGMTPAEFVKQAHVSQWVFGQHFYVPNPNGGNTTNPEWNFVSGNRFNGNPDAYVIAARLASAAAPTGSQDIDWVHLKNVKGSAAQEVYRTDTRLGQPPASCTPGSAPIQVRYSSKYYFLGSTLQ
ncbi:hypothetical protein CPB83DRAFT_859261 [Crepidotus variabilis]|uniref:Malate dehydrogenase n=1 Tax=Crepidotus variabilis TaxID=179855 RepID=A0A9P6JMC1_9AGAR|nr:hypothetical protein CPB83DRAFT_859261 [Crepidotus variabilis]